MLLVNRDGLKSNTMSQPKLQIKEFNHHGTIYNLSNFFSNKCKMWRTGELYKEDSWYCIEDSGLHCGKVRSARIGESNNKLSNDPVSFTTAFKELEESPEVRTKKNSQ